MALLPCLDFGYCCMEVGDMWRCFNHWGNYKRTIPTTKANHAENGSKETEGTGSTAEPPVTTVLLGHFLLGELMNFLYDLSCFCYLHLKAS